MACQCYCNITRLCFRFLPASDLVKRPSVIQDQPRASNNQPQSPGFWRSQIRSTRDLTKVQNFQHYITSYWEEKSLPIALGRVGNLTWQPWKRGTAVENTLHLGVLLKNNKLMDLSKITMHLIHFLVLLPSIIQNQDCCVLSFLDVCCCCPVPDSITVLFSPSSKPLYCTQLSTVLSRWVNLINFFSL